MQCVWLLFTLGHKTLYKILNMEDVDVKKYDRLFHAYFDKFTNNLNAREVTEHLLTRNILQYVTFVWLLNFAARPYIS